MSDINNKTTGRSLVISEEVISKIACVAAKEVSGVKDVVSYPSELKTFLITARFFRPVRINNADKTLTIDINISVTAGARVHEVAERVQDSVKNAVQNMTGYVVTGVNVNIEDIDLPDAAE